MQDEATVVGLLQIARLDRERRRAKGWWKHEPEAIGLSEYIAMEDVASRIRTWQLAFVPGLFQTADYVRALAVSGNAWEDRQETERIAAVRMKRQLRLTDARPLTVHAVVWEASLRQLVGGAEVMREQLIHLTEVARLPNVHLQVLPFRAGSHMAMGGAFSIVSFADSSALDIVYMDTIASTQWAENVGQSEAHAQYFELAAKLSLSAHAIAKLIDDIAKGI